MNKRIPIVLGIIMMMLACWMLITPTKLVRSVINRLDNLGYDLQLRAHVFTHRPKPESRVAIIDIDDASLKSEGRWPWPRNKIAALVNELEKQGAAVIAFDIFFSEKENNIAETLFEGLNNQHLMNASLANLLKKSQPLFDNDKVFAQSLLKNQTILAIGFLPRPQTENLLPPPALHLTPTEQDQLNLIRAKGYISNIPILQKAAKGGGFINIFSDSDGIIRHAPLLIEYKNGVYPALALQAVIAYLGENITLVTPSYNKTKKLEGIRLGTYIIPTDEKGQVLIPFIGKSYSFNYYSATDVLHNRLPKDSLLGKILFVGTSATGLGDLQATAIESPYPGVEVQATLVNGILKNNFSYKPAWTFGANLFLTFLLGLIASWVFPYLGPRILGLIIVLLPPGLIFINNWIWTYSGLVLSGLMPVILVLMIAIFNIIYGYLFETRKREQLKEMFGQYVPEKHIDEMLKTSSDYGLQGETRDMSVLFADIRNFTGISENRAAAEIVEMLNTFFTPMTEIIFKHQGTIDKYVGDLIMAFWGAPLQDIHHARHAIESALEMQAKVKAMRAVLQEHKWPAIQIGIGINSGLMSVGDMGSRFRRNYTVLGDAVNLASRVESLSKFYDAEIIVTENTQKDQSNFVFRQLDRVRVKGKKDAITIYEVVCFYNDLNPELKQELALYHQALQYYFQQKWEDAYVLMNQLLQTYSHKKIYSLYVQRIQEFKQHPLPADWDGVYIHLTK